LRSKTGNNTGNVIFQKLVTRMATSKLSDAKIKTLKPQEKIYRILDADRLYIEVRPTGVKVWRFKFVYFDSVIKKLTTINYY